MIELTKNDHPKEETLLNNLGGSLARCFQLLGNVDDLNAAISTKVELMPEDHPNKPLNLYNLGTSLLELFKRLGSMADFNAAMSNEREAVDFTRDGHPDKFMHIGNLGSTARMAPIPRKCVPPSRFGCSSQRILFFLFGLLFRNLSSQLDTVSLHDSKVEKSLCFKE